MTDHDNQGTGPGSPDWFKKTYRALIPGATVQDQVNAMQRRAIQMEGPVKSFIEVLELNNDVEVAGVNTLRAGLKSTPARFARAMVELTTPSPFEFTTFFEQGAGGMVVQRNIPVYSLCEHHILPFFGKAHIAYIPGSARDLDDGSRGGSTFRIAGLSKLARTVQFYMRRLQVQERLTAQIADRLEMELDPEGVAVVLECEHFCMTMRGAMAPGATTTTTNLRGAFMDNPETRDELFTLLSR